MILNKQTTTATSIGDEREARFAHLVATLRGSGHRMTRQREAVLRALVFSDRHPAIDELFQEARRAWPRLSLATVYKVIDTLRKHGEVLELSVGSGANRYDGFRPHDHPHMRCTACGAIADLPVSSLSVSLEEVAQGLGYRIEGYRFDLFGRCPQCQEQEETSGRFR